jgi:tetratricopeptide (TPR) repeat protein
MRNAFPCCLLALTLASACSRSDKPPAASAESGAPPAAGAAPPIYDNLGTHHHAVTASPDAQRYFDQGLRLTYAFNHEEAINSFRAGAERDPGCAMCWWGVALALGPNINLPMDTSAIAPARDAVKRAEAAAAKASPAERDYIAAVAARYADANPERRAALDSAYARAMADLAHKYPGDDDAQTLYAEALMDLQPWHYYTVGGQPLGAIGEITGTLERVVARSPNHPGACHYYIHAVEASHDPDRAVPCAERLAELMPGAGHLVHMPSHIYLRVGRYADAAMHNEHAVHADEALIERRHQGMVYTHGYYTHNWHVLWTARMMQGKGDSALFAARKVVENTPIEVVRAFPPLEYYLPVVYYTLVRFGRWDEMLKEPAPPAELRVTSALWHYTRGLALVAKGQMAVAQLEQDSLTAMTAGVPEQAALNLNPAKAVLAVADRHLRAELALAQHRRPEAIRLLREAVAKEDSLTYDEPPPWYLPMHEVLGQALLAGGDARGAEAAFREDLERNRENGWALKGLAASLRMQGRAKEAAEVEARFRKAWPDGEIAMR